jgi:hypothetical protein
MPLFGIPIDYNIILISFDEIHIDRRKDEVINHDNIDRR